MEDQRVAKTEADLVVVELVSAVRVVKKAVVKKVKATSTPTSAIKVVDGVPYGGRDMREETGGMASARGGSAGEPGHGGMVAGPGDNLLEEEEQVGPARAAVTDARECLE